MPNTYTQIHVQLVFAVRFRQALITKEYKSDLFKYMTGIIQHYEHKVLAINGVPDHIHILIGQRPTQALSELVQKVKANSSKWINEQRFVPGRFEWQSGFGAFSYSKSQVETVINYIRNQEEHHKHVRFLDEYQSFLNDFEIDYDGQYIFTELE